MMIHNNVERPPRLYGAADQQLQQVYRYLYTLSEQVQNVFDSIEMDDETAKRLKELQDKIAAVERAVGLKPGKKAFTQVEEAIGKQNADLSLLGQDVNILGQNVNILGQNMVTIQAGVGDNAARLTLAEGKITANANAILLKADQADLTLAEGKITANANAILLKADQADLTLAEGKITANANAIALKADQADLTLAEGRIAAMAEEITLKADKIDLLGYVTATQLETEVLSVVNGANIQTLTVTNMNPYYTTGVQATFSGGLEAGSVSSDMVFIGGDSVDETSLKMGSLISTNIWGFGNAIDLSHSHEVTVNADGTVTLGEVSSEGGNFKIADTKVYKDGVAAATTKGAESLVFYAGGKEGVADLEYGTSLSITATTTRADGTALAKGILVKAPPDNYNTGWNECIDHCSATVQLHRITQAAPGTLYMLQGNNYVSVGSSWVQVAAVYNTYFIPERK